MRIAAILILIILFNNWGLNGQTRTISGRVVSEDLEAMPGVIVQNRDKFLLAKTDLEGRFKINIQNETDKLIFSCIGMELTQIELHDKCATVEVVMLYAATYDFFTSRKVDRLRKKRFDDLPSLHSDAVRTGLFNNDNICYENVFITHNPTKPVLDSLSKAYKSKRNQIKSSFEGLDLGDTIRIPFSRSWRDDGTDRTTLHLYSNSIDRNDFDCIVNGVITGKNKRKGAYNLVCRVIECKDCHYDKIVLSGTELKVGETFEYNMKYYKILKYK